MASGFLGRLLSPFCSHEFSWPRSGEEGAYQVCMRCGDRYAYDWKKMQRGKRLAPLPADAVELKPVASSGRWTPRARRLRVNLQAQVRSAGQAEWQSATVENLSQSGVMLACGQSFSKGAAVELLFEMPSEISGQESSKALCQATVTRVTERPSRGGFGVAAAIGSYVFLNRRLEAERTAEPPPRRVVGISGYRRRRH